MMNITTLILGTFVLSAMSNADNLEPATKSHEETRYASGALWQTKHDMLTTEYPSNNEFHSLPGVLALPKSDLFIKYGTLRIIIYDNIKNIIQKSEILENQFYQITKNNKHSMLEEPTIHYTFQEVIKMKRETIKLKELLGKNRSTKKRALTFIGEALQWIGGVGLDQDVKNLEKYISAIKNRQDNTLDILDEEIHLLNNTIRKQEKIEEKLLKIQINFNNLQNKLTSWEQLMNTESEKIVRLEFLVNVNILGKEITDTTAELEEIIIAITETLQSIPNPTLIDMEEIYPKLRETEKKIQPFFTLPNINMNPLSIYKTLELESYYAQDYDIIISLKFPIIKATEKFKEYELIPIIDKAKDNINHKLEVSKNNIGISKSRNEIFELTEEIKCKQFLNYKICDINKITLLDEEDCVYNIMTNNNYKVRETCNSIIVNNPKTIIKHLSDNKYLINTVQVLNGKTICLNESTKAITIPETKIITLPFLCDIQIGKEKLLYRQSIKNNINSEVKYEKITTIPLITTDLKTLFEEDINISEIISSDNENNYKEMEYQAKKITERINQEKNRKDIEFKNNQKTNISIASGFISSSFLTILLTYGIYYYLRKRKSLKAKRENNPNISVIIEKSDLKHNPTTYPTPKKKNLESKINKNLSKSEPNLSTSGKPPNPTTEGTAKEQPKSTNRQTVSFLESII